ncbi:hypothetical protein X975_03896, partial [Stegodyphus mimosarum]
MLASMMRQSAMKLSANVSLRSIHKFLSIMGSTATGNFSLNMDLLC